ncbi:unnamed protein product [Vicia faba]|uniref:Uncharacterized protein n=1 Tax=Vicia faba TaxID=3906 RepID=A0AAV0ZC87_VICFA|nr:unnamed protein product [Vicia faba]
MWSPITDAIRIIFSTIVQHCIHKDFHEAVAKMSIIHAFLFLLIHSIDKLGMWHRLPVFMGLFYLPSRRHLHQHYNLFNVGQTPVGISEGSFFGRNILPVDQKDKLLKPDPMVVATKLLARKTFKDTGKQFNVLAAAWIQFMIHDWIDPLEDTQQIEFTAPHELANQCPLKSFKFLKTKEIPTGFYDIKTGHANIRTPWWRLEADRFYTSNFNEETYTKKGFEWVNTTESLKDVIDRHYPGMTDKWLNASSTFSVWDAPPNIPNPIPIYLRTPS